MIPFRAESAVPASPVAQPQPIAQQDDSLQARPSGLFRGMVYGALIELVGVTIICTVGYFLWHLFR